MRLEFEETRAIRRSWLGLDIMASLVLVMIVGLNLWLFTSVSPMIWVDQIADDAYYYLGIARSLAEHGRFEFLPPFETNGFQPLWQALLAVAALAGGTSTRAMVIECYGLSAGFVALFVVLSRRLNGSALAAALITLLFPTVMLSGMETVMIPAFALLFLNARGWKLRGVLGALIFLSRLDAISFVVARDVYGLIRRREVDVRHYAIIGPVALGYVAFNYLQFGVYLPVSGLAKSLHMTPFENITMAKQYLIWAIPALGILAIALAAKAMTGTRSWNLKYGEEMAISTMAATVCALYYGSLSGWPLWAWYAWAPMLVTYYATLEAIAIVRADVAQKRIIVPGAAMAAIGVIIVFTGGAGYASNTGRLLVQAHDHAPLTANFARKNLELVDWVKARQLPHGTMFAMGDRAGSFGFFLGEDYRFLHAEGLVADASYYRAMKDDAALAYVKRLPIDYWIADRVQYLQSDAIFGVAEPVQGMSMHKGGYMICFGPNAIVNDQSYPSGSSPTHVQTEQRYVFDMKARVECPDPMQAEFEALRAGYGRVRAFSLPIEQATRGMFNPYVKRFLGL